MPVFARSLIIEAWTDMELLFERGFGSCGHILFGEQVAEGQAFDFSFTFLPNLRYSVRSDPALWV